MKLTASQIQDLYTFTKQHYVEYYDLQTELVDHLANDIEIMWQDEPKLSFEDAKHRAFKKFGIFGFMEPIEQKQKAMNKRYMRYLWNELKQWFELPQLLSTIALFIAFYMLFSTQHAVAISVMLYVVIAIWCLYKTYRLNQQFKLRKQKSNKKWLLEEMIFRQAGGTVLFFLSQVYNIFIISDEFLNNTYIIVALALVYTLLVLINYISFEIIPSKAENLLNETYPEFSL